MLIPSPPLIFRKRKTIRRRKPNVSPVGPLELVAATLQVTEWVDLTFSRAVELVGGVGASSTVRVFDGDVGFEYVGDGDMVLVSPTVVRVMIVGLGEWMEPGVTLDVAEGNGIVGVEDGAAWVGASGIVLPFP